MAITLGFLASVLIILPGLVGLAAFNLRAGQAGARRPEQTLTSISALVSALLISLLVHLFGFLVAEGAIQFALAVHDTYPIVDLGSVPMDPLTAFYHAVTGGPKMPVDAALGLAVLLIVEIMAVVAFASSDTLELALDRVDLGGRGWVFQHITRPAEHGYAPLGHVFTSVINDGYGVAYKGPIIDIRQSEKGEVLSVALSRPERFLYKVGDFSEAEPRRWPWQQPTPAPADETESGITLYPKDYVGGVVALDAKVISNIVVHSISQKLLAELSEGEEVDDGDPPG